MKKYMNVQQLSDYLWDHPSIETLRRYARGGKLPFEGGGGKGKKYRFVKSEIDKWEKNGRNI